MTIQDLFVTPIYIILFSLVAFLIRPYVTKPQNRRYFLPALWFKFFGAIVLGVIYYYYYGAGDTINYFTHGSRWIWEAFLSDYQTGFSLLVDSGGNIRDTDTFIYNSRIWYYRDPKSFMIVRLTAFFDLFTLHTYSATALYFAAFSFSGLWAMYHSLSLRYSQARYLHIAVLFVPSVVFWGSGILKDTVTLGALGWLTWSALEIIENKKRGLLRWGVALLSALLIVKVKPYIVLSFLPTVFIWLYLKNISSIRIKVVRRIVAPFLGIISIAGSVFALNYLGTNEYSLDSFASKAAVTAHDIRYGWGARSVGDGAYDLGGLPDGSITSMIRLLPAAVNVSLFRPYIWEVRNPLMFLSALESLFITFLTLNVIITGRWKRIIKDPFLIFCLIFSVLFAFAVGISTYNFGTLMRYKIPLIPFYTLLLIQYSNTKATNSTFIPHV